MKNTVTGIKDLMKRLFSISDTKQKKRLVNWTIGLKNITNAEDKKMENMGVPVVAQWKRIRLVSMRMRVQSLALLSGVDDPVFL